MEIEKLPKIRFLLPAYYIMQLTFSIVFICFIIASLLIAAISPKKPKLFDFAKTFLDMPDHINFLAFYAIFLLFLSIVGLVLVHKHKKSEKIRRFHMVSHILGLPNVFAIPVIFFNLREILKSKQYFANENIPQNIAPKDTKVIRSDLIFDLINQREFDHVYERVFDLNEYKFETENKKPFIIDCGAHIGVATLYFKKNYPDSSIVAIEANPKSVEILKTNIEENSFKNVKIIHGALTKEGSEVSFYIDPNEVMPWTLVDSTVKDMWGTKIPQKEIKVPAVRLSKFITKKVDFLKIDIEGSELEVIEEAEKKLKQVKEIFVEFHENEKNPIANLEKIKEILTKAGFTITVEEHDWTIVRGKR